MSISVRHDGRGLLARISGRTVKSAPLRAIVRRHGATDADIRAIVRHHHERWDGTGYPDGLAGEGIPLLARALAVADSYDAITTERPYKPALSHERAMARLAEATGTHFDPRVVEAFQRAVRRGTLTAIQASTPAAHSRYAGSSFVSISGLLQQVRERGDGGDDGTTAA